MPAAGCDAPASLTLRYRCRQQSKATAKSLKQRIYVNTQDNYFVQCVSPKLIQSEKMSSLGQLVAGVAKLTSQLFFVRLRCFL